MKILEVIKDYFAPGYSKKLANPEADAKLLADMSSRIIDIKASNGKKYQYFFVSYSARPDVMLFLARRNGVKMQFHNSSYNSTKHRDPVLRIREDVVNKNPEVKEFLDKVKAYEKLNKSKDEAYYQTVIRQMHGKVK